MAKDAYDRAQGDHDTALARRDLARATARCLSAVVAKTHIVAPIDGVVITRHVQPGEMVERGARSVTIADLRRTRVEPELRSQRRRTVTLIISDQAGTGDRKIAPAQPLFAEGVASSSHGPT